MAPVVPWNLEQAGVVVAFLFCFGSLGLVAPHVPLIRTRPYRHAQDEDEE